MTATEPTVEELILNNRGLVGFVLRHYMHMTPQMTPQMSSWDDLYSFGLMVLVRCARGFKPELNIKFTTYVCKSLCREFPREIKKDINRGLTPVLAEKPRTLSMSRIMEDGYDVATEGERNTLDLQWYLSFLRPRHRHIIRARFQEDKTLKEVGEELGIGKERVRQLEAQALQQLRQMLLRNEKGVSDACDAVHSG